MAPPLPVGVLLEIGWDQNPLRSAPTLFGVQTTLESVWDHNPLRTVPTFLGSNYVDLVRDHSLGLQRGTLVLKVTSTAMATA